MYTFLFNGIPCIVENPRKLSIIRNSVKSEKKKKVFIVGQGKTLNEFSSFYPTFRHIRFQTVFSLERE